MMEAFRGSMGSDELVQRLFSTANKQAPCNVPATYGQGCVDADAATRPVGSTSVATADASKTFSAAATRFLTPPAFGDSLKAQVASEEIAAFDELDAPFFIPLASTFDTVPVERLRSFMSFSGLTRQDTYREGHRVFRFRGLDPGFVSGLPADDLWGQTAMPYMNLVGDQSFTSGLGFFALGEEMRVGVFLGTPSYLMDDVHEYTPAQGVVMSYGAPERLEMNIGVLHEEDRIFGGAGDGGFAEDVRSQHIFGGFSKKFDFGKMHLFVGGQVGVTWILGSEGYLLRFPFGDCGEFLYGRVWVVMRC